MAGKYSELIENYCMESTIEIPAGFYRHSASHIAVIRLDLEKPKLVAKTFFKKADLNYYLKNLVVENTEADQIARVVDFKTNKEYLVGKDGKPNEL
jgi:hypothetical protein